MQRIKRENGLSSSRLLPLPILTNSECKPICILLQNEKKKINRLLVDVAACNTACSKDVAIGITKAFSQRARLGVFPSPDRLVSARWRTSPPSWTPTAAGSPGALSRGPHETRVLLDRLEQLLVLRSALERRVPQQLLHQRDLSGTYWPGRPIREERSNLTMRAYFF